MIKERIIQLIEYKGIPKEKFYTKIGMTSANFRGESKKRPINSNAIENILTVIPDVNTEWLITGKGNMLKGVDLPPDKNYNETERSLIDKLLESNDKLIKSQQQEIAQLKTEIQTLKREIQPPKDEDRVGLGKK